MLTSEEQSLVRELFHRGPSVLAEHGFGEDAARSFMSRPDVVEHLRQLTVELEHADALGVRSRFLAQRDLAKLSRHATAVLARALAGPQYLRGVDERTGERTILTDARGNPILSDAEITPIQLRAAENVMEALGIPKGSTKAVGGSADVDALYARTESRVQLEEDPSHEREADRALSRERVRNVIARLAGDIPEMKRKLDETLGIVDAEVVKRPRKKTKKPRKKAKTSGGASAAKKKTRSR